MQLTKSRYVSAVQCQRRLWLEIHRPELAPPPTPVTQRLLAQGNEVGSEARRRFPGGILIQQGGRRGAVATRQAMAAGYPAIFEATFLYEDLLVRCDIFLREADGRWTIVEVKSGTDVQLSYLHDLAIQRHVVERAGVPVAGVKLMHINSKSCTYPNLENLFVLCDVTAEVAEVAVEVPGRLQRIWSLLASGDEPETAIGAHCDDPMVCPYRSYCWQHVPEISIFNIPRLDGATKSELARRGVFTLDAIPDDIALSPQQRACVDLLLSGATEIDHAAIAQEMARLVYPIYFFDFETDATPIPLFDGLHPYQAFPFQYSCHVLHADGRLEHFDYLHDDAGDPRRPLVLSLLGHIGPTGSVVAYYASFERTVLQKLAAQLPEYAAPLHAIVERLWDQWDIFRKYYRSAAFHGSNSIKHVLPALVPELSYAGLAVRKGDQAQAHWRAMIVASDPEERTRRSQELRAYCGLDTLAMVELHRVLERTVAEVCPA
jgi:hypothetical protein